MQNYYAVERFIQERNGEARAIAEMQGLRRRAASTRRARRWAGLLGWLRVAFAGPESHPGESSRKAEPVGET